MTKGKIVFTGNFWEFFFGSLGFGVLCILTLGLLLPLGFYWQVTYFINHMEVEFVKASKE
jgi:uncharacterized membrane protein YjgN (DUF898 family)